jgi:general secretion pathway protein G
MSGLISPRQRGFTLIEMMVTVAIVGVLASIAVPLAEVGVQRAREQELRHALREIRTALDAYRKAVEEGRIPGARQDSGYPASLQVLVDGVDDARSPTRKKRIRFLRRIPRDPFFTDPTRPDEETWGKRSYASSPDAPEEGSDVYDVYSLAPGTGMNGIPYSRW